MNLWHVDVFGQAALLGNPLAVCVGELPDGGLMQRMANWLNLSETTFASPSADQLSYHVRIFTPRQELPFAGHPSIGTAAVLYRMGLLRADAMEFTQHCAAGALKIFRDSLAPDCHWFVQAPDANVVQLDDSALVALNSACGLTISSKEPRPMVINNGPRWAVAGFSSVDQLLAMQPDYTKLAAWNQHQHNIGLAAYARGYDALGPYLEVRCFVPLDGIPEDPVTGSGNAAVAAFLHHFGAARELGASYRARQGRAMGRDGRLQLRINERGQIAVGGLVHSVAQGRFTPT